MLHKIPALAPVHNAHDRAFDLMCTSNRFQRTSVTAFEIQPFNMTIAWEHISSGVPVRLVNTVVGSRVQHDPDC